MTAFVRVIERITGSAGLLIAWVVFPLILASVYEVVARYAFNAPTIWAFELGYMAMGIHAMIGAAFALRERAHIRIDVIYMRFPDKAKAVIDTIGYLVLFMPVVCWVSLGLWDYWMEAFVRGEHSGQSAWNPIIWPFRLSFFLGFFLLALQGLAELIKCFQFLSGQTKEWNPTDG
jgi:TRAP-type mannitol/chloroaromatic compound transport system permease small subunit